VSIKYDPRGIVIEMVPQSKIAHRVKKAYNKDLHMRKNGQTWAAMLEKVEEELTWTKVDL